MIIVVYGCTACPFFKSIKGGGWICSKTKREITLQDMLNVDWYFQFENCPHKNEK